MIKRIAALVLAALFLLPTICYSALRVTIRNDAFVTGKIITLGDIAEITGDDQARIEMLKQIYLGTAPLPGSKTAISRDNLTARLTGSQVDFSGVEWDTPPEFIAITAGGQVISGQTLLQAAKAKLAARFPASGQLEFSIAILQEIPDMIAPLGEIDYSLSGQMMRLGVVQTAYLTIAVDGVQYSRIPVKCEIKRFEPVLTAAATISARQKLTADSVRLMRLDTSRLPDDYLRNPAQAVDLMVNRSLAAGSVILASYLDKPVLIKRGTPVKIVAAIGGVEATAAGLAQRDGREGQFISVRNTATGRLLTARVIRAGLVEVLAN